MRKVAGMGCVAQAEGSMRLERCRLSTDHPSVYVMAEGVATVAGASVCLPCITRYPRVATQHRKRTGLLVFAHFEAAASLLVRSLLRRLHISG